MPRFSRNSMSPVGGTALPQPKQGSPLLAVAVAVVVGGGFIAFFALRGGTRSHAAPAPTPAPAPITSTTPPTPPAPSPAAIVAPTAPDGGAIADELQRKLQLQRLWSTVSAIGARVEVQSSSCRDPQMKVAIDAAASSFKAAGLTRVRCVEQSGAVAFERAL